MGSVDFRFALLAFAICAVVSVMAIGATMRFWQTYEGASHSLRRAGEFRDILLAGYRLAIEREPAAGLMIAPPGSAAVQRERLLHFQKTTDAALFRISASRPGGDPIRLGLVDAARKSLALARADVARVAALPPQERNVRDLRTAFNGMAASFDRFQDILYRELRGLDNDPSLAAIGTVGLINLQMRDAAGRLGTLALPNLALGEKLGFDEVKRAERLRGRTLLLWSLLRAQPDFGVGKPLEAMAATASEDFVGGGLAFISSVGIDAATSAHGQFAVEDIGRYYVPTLKPLEEIGQANLSTVFQRLEKAQSDALHSLVIVSIGSGLLLCLLLGLLFWVEKKMLAPLRAARQTIVGLATSSALPPFPQANRIGEIRRLFDALTVLQQRLRERDVAMVELKRQAATDGLTGIANRRALEALANAPEGEGKIASLVIADIDHFKAINDTYGHLLGDDALRLVATLFKEAAPEGSLLARFGGEEFALLLPGHDRFAAAAIAEALRCNLASKAVPSPTGGAAIEIRASFGVATGRLGPAGWPRLTEAADQALYRAKTEGRDCVRMAA